MRICLYTNTALPKVGGQEIVIDALARQFLALGHEPVVLAPWRRSQGPFDPTSVPYRVAWHPRFVSTYWFVSWYGHWMAKARRTYGFDVIHCHGTYPAGYVGTCCRAVSDLPLVVTSHGDDLAPQGLFDRKPKLRDRYRMVLAQADAAVAISSYTDKMFRETCPELRRIVPIPNGVEVEQFASPVPRPTDVAASIRSKSYLLFLGRLDPRKGIDVLLEAMALLRGQCDRDVVVAGRRTGSPGTASPGRTSRSWAADPFRGPNYRPAKNVVAAKRPLHDRSIAHVGSLSRGGDREPGGRPAGDRLAIAGPCRSHSARTDRTARAAGVAATTGRCNPPDRLGPAARG